MLGIQQFLDGKKANMSAGWMFAGAIYLMMTGATVNPETGDIVMLSNGEGQMATILTALSVGLATLRASNTKIQKALKAAAPVLIGTLAVGVGMAGCAALGVTNPDTGTTPAQDLQEQAVALAALFGPGVAATVSIASGVALNAATVLGQMMDNKATS